MDQAKPYRIILRPLGQTKRLQEQVARFQDLINQYNNPADLARFPYMADNIKGWQQAVDKARGAGSKERIIDADRIEQIGDDMLAAHIDDAQPPKSRYLTMNVDNIISINGKPVMNILHLDKGLSHLDIEDDPETQIEDISRQYFRDELMDKQPINETSGICKDCMKGYHEDCDQVLGTSASGPVFCTCYCTGNTSFGNILYKEPIPKKIKDEFAEKFPTHEGPDPLDQVF